MSKSIFAAGMFTTILSDIVNIPCAQKFVRARQLTLFEHPARRMSKQFDLDRVPVCLCRLYFSAGITTNLNHLPRLRTGICHFTPKVSKSCASPVPAHSFLLYFTLGPCHKEVYDEKFAPEYSFYLSRYHSCNSQLPNQRRIYEYQPSHSATAA